jgi:hypothetical protein
MLNGKLVLDTRTLDVKEAEADAEVGVIAIEARVSVS